MYVGMIGHKAIPLWGRGGVIRGWAIVDKRDAHHADDGHWRLKHSSYAARNVPGLKSVYLHRAILELQGGDGLVVDHINGNPLDCRRSNMRVCTQAENLQNTAPRVGFASAYRGVSWATREGKWMARVTVAGRPRHVGYFADEIKAAEAAQEFRRVHLTHTNEDRHPIEREATCSS